MRSLALWVLAILAFSSTPVHGQAGKTLSPKELFEKASPAVAQVHVYTRGGKLIRQGSGFFVSADGLLATNYHVIAKAASAKVVLADGKEELAVSGMVACMPNADLALLKVNGKKLPFLPIAREKPKVGTKVYAIGSPEGLTNTLSDGLVSGVRKVSDTVSVIQTTAPISRGSSGGPLLIDTGEVVGVTTARLVTGQNLNFAVPSELLHKLLATPKRLIPLSKTTLKEPIPPARTYSTITSILKELPLDTFPITKGTRKWPKLTRDLFYEWAKKNLVGQALCLKVHWPGVDELKFERINRSIRARVRYKEKCFDGWTYHASVRCIFPMSASATLTNLPERDVYIRGRISSVYLSSPRRRSIDIEFYLLDCTILTRREAQEATRKPRPPRIKIAPKRELTKEQKAQGKLRLARMYLRIGKEDKAKAVFETVVCDFPKTKAAAQAKEELERLKMRD